MTWINHQRADLAVLPIIMSEKIQPHMIERFFPFDHFHIQKTPASRDIELTSVGFPNGLGAHGQFSPLTYRSYASSSFPASGLISHNLSFFIPPSAASQS